MIRPDDLEMYPESDRDESPPPRSSPKRTRREQEVFSSDDEDEAGAAVEDRSSPLYGRFGPDSPAAAMETTQANVSPDPSSIAEALEALSSSSPSAPAPAPAPAPTEPTEPTEPTHEPNSGASSSSVPTPAPTGAAESNETKWDQLMKDNWIDMALHESEEPLSILIKATGAKLKADAAEIKARLDGKYEDLVAEQQRYLETRTREITSKGGPDMCKELSGAVRSHDIRINEIQEQRAHEEKQYQKAAAAFPDFDKLDTLLTCPVEQAKTAEPVMLTCGHLIGRTSALELQRRSKDESRPFHCPVCRKTNSVRITIKPKQTTASVLLGALIPAGI